MGLVKLPLDQQLGEDIDFPSDGKSLDIDDVSETLIHSSINCSHFKNRWSVAAWFQTSGAGGHGRIFDVTTTTVPYPGAFNIAIEWETSTNLFSVYIKNLATFAPPILKNYDVSITTNTWYHCVVTYDSSLATAEELKIYINGALQTPTKNTDSAGVDRGSAEVDSITLFATSNSDNHSLAIWNSVLNANAVAEIYNGGDETFNLMKNSGRYRKKKRLKHWFVFELDSSTDLLMGRDWGRDFYKNNSENINVMTNAVGITAAADLVGTTPSGR